jgi:hypothetical protein
MKLPRLPLAALLALSLASVPALSSAGAGKHAAGSTAPAPAEQKPASSEKKPGHDAEQPEHDEKVPLASLPKAVVDAIAARWPGATLLEAEKERGGFEVEFKATDGVRYEAEVSPDGTIGDVEVEDDDHGEDDGDDGEDE